MVVIGLTGSIGMGKSTAATMFRCMGVPVHDSDADVHALLSFGGEAVAAVGEAFDGVLHNHTIDRGQLARQVFNNPGQLHRLETILHPLVRRDRQRFLAACRRTRNHIVVVDVPLLFETESDRDCDMTVVVTAPYDVQRTRVSGRPGMNTERFNQILSRQMSDIEKQNRADYVVPTGLGIRVTLRSLAQIVRLAKRRLARRGGCFKVSRRRLNRIYARSRP